MQTIQELADNFYTRYENHGDGFGHSSNTYNKRKCEQIREQIEYHVTEALKAASENGKINIIPVDEEQWEHVPEIITSDDIIDNEGIMLEIDKSSILSAYPLENIK